MAEFEEDLDATDEEGKYVVEAILSEGMVEGPDGTEVWMYLVKWKGYEMHECTWEPPEHFGGTNLLELWEKKKKDDKKAMGPEAFGAWMVENEIEFDNAVRRHEEQQKDPEANPSAAGDDHQSDEDVSRRLPNPESGQRATSPASALARREPTDESQLNSLFIGSQDVPSPDRTPKGRTEGGLFFRQSPIPRRPPLQQSGSSSSEEEADEAAGLSDDSLMGELQQKAKKPRRKSTTGPSPRTERQIPRRPVQSPRSPAKTTKSVLNATKGATQGTPKAPRKRDSLNSSSNVESTGVREQGDPQSKPKAIRSMNKPSRLSEATFRATSSTQRKASSNVGPSALASKAPTTKAVVASAPRSVQMNQPVTSALPSTTENTFGSKTQAIKFVNQPKPKPRQWKEGDTPFKTLHARHIAYQRSRVEGTPELGALTFPAGPPQGLPKAKTQATDDDLYGRRETRPRRVQEDDMDEDDNSRRASIGGGGPLKSWEVGKIPQICPRFRLSNDCPLGARKCQYMHQDKDPEGHDYPIGDVHGWIPPKYRTPAVTCPYWLELWGTLGCGKSDDACKYAHRNTGFAPQSQANRDVIKIDPNLRPATKTRRPSQPEIGYIKRKNSRPSELTCWYWANGDRCHHTAENCRFQHHHTGVVADGPYIMLRNTVPYSRGIEGAQYTRSHDKSDLGRPPMRDEHDGAEMGNVTQPVEDGSVGIPRQTHVEHQHPPSLALPPPPPAVKSSATQGCAQMNMMIEKTCKLDFMDMFTSNKDGNKIVDKRAFLMYHPSEHAEDLDVVTRWLLMHHVEVGSPWYDGSWNNFTQQIMRGGSGVIIVHPDFDYFTELPDFGKVLRKQVRLWSIGVQEGIEFDIAVSASAQLRYDRTEIFPLGGFIYITEDVFEKQPQMALSIVKAFFAKIEKLRRLEGPNTPWHEVSDAPLFWRLCVRPELMEYLIQHCEKHAEELEAGDLDVRSRAELYTLLSDTNYIDQDIPTSPLSLIADKYPIISERRIIAETQPVDYFNALKHSQEDANLRIIRYFAGLQVGMRRDYRHFYVVHTEPLATCAQQWKQEVQTISEVMSPEKCFEELKDGSESLFDFCERHMPVCENTGEK